MVVVLEEEEEVPIMIQTDQKPKKKTNSQASKASGRWDVRLVGLFDPSAGSARNFGIVVVPRT